VIDPEEPERVKERDPKNKESLYLALSKVKAKNSEEEIVPNTKSVFSSPITKSCH
jgi:hypothetical protein